jgi:ribonuclease PH
VKRYRVLKVDFDTRATLLNLKIEDSWEPNVKQHHVENKAKIVAGLLEYYGAAYGDVKLKNFCELGAVPFSIVAYHNKFLHHIRRSFVMGAYYPALTGACALGERILNHLLLSHRDFFKDSIEYKNVYRKESFDNWDVPIGTLNSWGILLPDTITAFNELRDIRNRALHFRPETDHNDRSLALTAIQTLERVINCQFAGFGTQPWFIPNTPGTTFLKKSVETDPFIRTVYLPNCVLVGPYHTLEHSSSGWIVHDNFTYEDKEIFDEEFARLHNDRASHPKNLDAKPTVDIVGPRPVACAMTRHDGRTPAQLRPVTFTPGFAPNATGSVLVSTGETRVICSAMVEEAVPRWMKDQQVPGGWVTAEYSMLPYSTLQRKQRDSARGKTDGRATEIQRLIGRSLRAALDLDKLGQRTMWIDCDVLSADGGTRTASITGASVAAALACRKLMAEGKIKEWPIKQLVTAVSVGIVNGVALLDLCYVEDRDAAVDLNVVMTEGGQFVEVQGSGEESTFSEAELNTMLALARGGIGELVAKQRAVIG